MFSNLFGQKMVQSSTYQATLSTLLSHTVPEISVDSLAKIKDEVILLDAREPQEYNVSHIANATCVGYDNFDKAAVKNLDKNKPVVVYCSVGYRSEKISEQLREMGFKNVSNLYGGIFEWKNQNQTVVNQKGPTEKVHAYSPVWGVWLKKGEKVYD
jgi:rhodanese-related sulfurtransferase